MVPQYPAALGLAFDRVIGVGSILDGNNKSDFSNYGPWVRCCAKGEDVVSTFITWYGQTEEVDPNPPAGVAGVPVDEDFIGWAKWQGTSFAAPKVAGALARRRAAGMTLTEAWDDLTALAQSPANLQMGVCLDELLPE
jgi:subtilisin family serine protease